MKKSKSTALIKNGFKIRVIAVILFLTVVAIGYFTVTSLIENGFFVNPMQIEPPTFDFETPDYDYDIFEDSDYLSLIQGKFMTYKTGTHQGYHEESIPEGEYSSYSEPVQLVIELVKAAQKGDSDAYNACFSQAYIDKEGNHPNFTMQQIYDVVITEWETENKGTYSSTEVHLEYKIRKNNGTLRNDIGSDASKAQQLTITTNNADGTFKIDSVTVVTELDSSELPPVDYNVGNIVLVSAISLIVLIASFLGIKTAFKKTKAKKVSDA